MSSLTRLLEGLPREFFDDGRQAQASMIMMGLGAGMLGVAGIFGIIATGTGEAGMLAGMAGPALAGVVNLGLGFLFRKRSAAASKLQITADARHLLMALMIERAPQRSAFVAHGRHLRMNSFQPLVVVPAPLEERLEAFADAYLDLKAAAERSPVHGMRARLAADEALVEGFNAAAAAIRHPDSDEVTKLIRLTEGMKEAAQRLDPTETAPPTLDALLTDLRDEEKARQELMG